MRFLGIGALYVRRRPRVRLEPLQSGGGQERGLRSGTVPTPLTVGLGAAAEVAQKEMEVRHDYMNNENNQCVNKSFFFFSTTLPGSQNFRTGSSLK